MNYLKYFFVISELKKKFNIVEAKSKNIILVEYFKYFPSLIAFGYFFNTLAKKHNAKVVCYHPRLLSFLSTLKYFFETKLLIFNKVLIAIGVKKFISIKKIYKNKKYLYCFNQIKKKLKNKNDVLKLKILDINLGFELYDHYLRENNKTEVDIQDENFQKCLMELIMAVFFWDHYFKNNKVKSVVISHTAYFMSIISKVAIKKKFWFIVLDHKTFFQ